MHSGIAVLLWALAAVPSAHAAEPHAQAQARAPQTDETVPVSRGTRLAIDNYAGEVVIHTWDKEAVHVQARHAARTRVSIRNGAGGISISAVSSNGQAGSVDYDITAPSWMVMKVEGHFNFVTIEGAQNEVSVLTVRGDIVVKGSAGSITAKTIEGEILVEGGRGKLSLSSVNQGIKVTGASGDVAADTTNGSITLSGMDATTVEAATINGNVSYDGTLAARGRYSFTTHNGDIALTVPESTNATFNVRTYNGEFATSLTLNGPDRSEVRRGRRVAYTLGNGSAEVEMESFGGAIRLRRAGAHRTGRDQ